MKLPTFPSSIPAVVASIAVFAITSAARADAPSPEGAPSAEPAPNSEVPAPPGFYFRFRVGPDARLAWHRYQSPLSYGPQSGHSTFDWSVLSTGLQLALAAGWAITPRTALAAETAVYWDRALGNAYAIPWTSIDGFVGLDATLLVDHYLDASRRGTHLQAAAGVGIARALYGTEIGAADNIYDAEVVVGPTLAGGIGYDWGAFGVLARVDTSYLSAAHTKLVPVSLFLGISLRSF